MATQLIKPAKAESPESESKKMSTKDGKSNYFEIRVE
jgi:hypothetical protein